jgi:hypothetical protein
MQMETENTRIENANLLQDGSRVFFLNQKK